MAGAAFCGRLHDRFMGKGHTRSTTPDLFSTDSAREPSPLSANVPSSSPSTAAPPRHVLPNDLDGAVKRLGDLELDRLLAAALAEQERRGRKPPVQGGTKRKPRLEQVEVPLTRGQMNAVRAAFKAGVKPSQIAR